MICCIVLMSLLTPSVSVLRAVRISCASSISLLDCSADEFCEGFACFSSLEFGVNHLVVDDGLQRRTPSHRYKSRSTNRLQNANRRTIEPRKLYFRTVSLTGKLTEGVGGSFKAKSGVVV